MPDQHQPEEGPAPPSTRPRDDVVAEGDSGDPLAWADGILTGPNERPPDLRNWLRREMMRDGKKIATVVCPDCHVEVGGVLDTRDGELLVLVGPPMRMPAPAPTPEPRSTDTVPGHALMSHAGPMLPSGVTDEGGHTYVHGRLVEGRSYIIAEADSGRCWVERSEDQWISFDPAHGAWVAATLDSVPTPNRPHRPDVSIAAWRWVNQPPHDEAIGPLRDDETCAVECNAEGERHLVTTAGGDIRRAIARYRRTGRARENHVVGTVHRHRPRG